MAFAAIARAAPGPDLVSVEAIRARDRTLTKPIGALGRLEETVEWLGAWQRRAPPSLDRVEAVVFAGNHGVAARGVSAYPADVTAQMVLNFHAGGAAINQLARSNGVGLTVRALELDRPTGDIAVEDAMSEQDCVAAMAAGADAVATGFDLVCLGEMGIGNTTPAAAICQTIFGGDAEQWVGPGTGVDAAGRSRKLEAVTLAVRRVNALRDHPLEILRRVGGREIAAIAGAIIAARNRRTPVMIDGYVATAAAAVVGCISPGAIDHCMIGHLSAEPAHASLARYLRKRPLLGLDMRLGEASGAVVAVAILRCALAAHCGMSSFTEAGVSGRLE